MFGALGALGPFGNGVLKSFGLLGIPGFRARVPGSMGAPGSGMFGVYNLQSWSV